MAKCSNCGRRGLFLKLDWRGWCPTCVAKEQLTKIEKEHRQRLEALNALNADISAAESKLADTSALLREAMDSAKRRGHERSSSRTQTCKNGQTAWKKYKVCVE